MFCADFSIQQGFHVLSCYSVMLEAIPVRTLLFAYNNIKEKTKPKNKIKKQRSSIDTECLMYI